MYLCWWNWWQQRWKIHSKSSTEAQIQYRHLTHSRASIHLHSNVAVSLFHFFQHRLMVLVLWTLVAVKLHDFIPTTHAHSLSESFRQIWPLACHLLCHYSFWHTSAHTHTCTHWTLYIGQQCIHFSPIFSHTHTAFVLNMVEIWITLILTTVSHNSNDSNIKLTTGINQMQYLLSFSCFCSLSDLSL